MTYEERKKREKLVIEIRRRLYIDLIEKAFLDDYEKSSPVEKIKVITTITEFGKLPNKFAS